MNGLRILLVDDEKMLLALLRRHLERAGYSVVGALSAELALEAIATPAEPGWAPDVLIADETLPGESGTSLAVALLERNPRLVCLLSSGYPLTLDAVPEALRPRAAILQKPFQPPALEAAIGAVLASRPASA
jgi:DNA-binding response OmpR family regulator